MDKGSSNPELHARLQEALRECEELRAENERLRALLKFSPENEYLDSGASSAVDGSVA